MGGCQGWLLGGGAPWAESERINGVNKKGSNGRKIFPLEGRGCAMAGIHRTAGSSGELSVVHHSRFGAQEGPWVLEFHSHPISSLKPAELSCHVPLLWNLGPTSYNCTFPYCCLSFFQCEGFVSQSQLREGPISPVLLTPSALHIEFATPWDDSPNSKWVGHSAKRQTKAVGSSAKSHPSALGFQFGRLLQRWAWIRLTSGPMPKNIFLGGRTERLWQPSFKGFHGLV